MNFIISQPFTVIAEVIQTQPLCDPLTTASCSGTLNNPVTAGDELVVVVSLSNHGANCPVPVFTMGDSLGNTFSSSGTNRQSANALDCVFAYVYYSTLSSSGSDTILMTLS